MLDNQILLQSLYDRNLNVFKKLIVEKHVQDNLNYANDKGENALLLSLHFDLPEITLEILKYSNIGIDQIDVSKNNSLILALKKQYEEIGLKILQNSLKNINFVDNHGDSALTCSLRYNQFSVIHKLLTYPTLDVNHVDSHGDNSLLIAINSNKEDIALQLLQKYKVDINYVHQVNKYNALNLSICKHMEKVANYLIEIGVDISYVNDNGESSLFCALNHDMFDLANKLSIKNSPNINIYKDVTLEQAINNDDEEMCLEIFDKDKRKIEIINKDNDTTLILALTHKMHKLSKLLIENGSEKFIRHTNNNKDCALFLCISNEYYDLVKMIINKKYYDINQKNSKGDNLIYFLINLRDEKIALEVLYTNISNFDFNLLDSEQNSLLILSIINGMENLSIGLLNVLEQETINKVNVHGDNALILSISNELWKLTEKLIQKNGVDINFINRNNNNSMLLLINSKQWNLVEMLLQNPLVDKNHRNRLNAYEILKEWNVNTLLHYFKK